MLFFALAALAAPLLASALSCNISDAKLVLPANQTALTPTPGPPSYITAAFGVQNYTCDATSHKYVSVGAVAAALDISCLYGTPHFQSIQDDMYKVWSHLPPSFTIQDTIALLGNKPFVLGQHYFIANPNGTTPAIVPKWDFTSASQKGNPNAYVIGAKIGDLPAPTGSGDIDWLQLKGTSGSLAKVIYRVDTKAGQPPANCTPGGPLLSVKYATKYWLY